MLLGFENWRMFHPLGLVSWIWKLVHVSGRVFPAFGSANSTRSRMGHTFPLHIRTVLPARQVALSWYRQETSGIHVEITWHTLHVFLGDCQMDCWKADPFLWKCAFFQRRGSLIINSPFDEMTLLSTTRPSFPFSSTDISCLSLFNTQRTSHVKSAQVRFQHFNQLFELALKLENLTTRTSGWIWRNSALLSIE